MRTRRATSARPSRPSRVVKELMAALMRFPAAVYQFSFVNVAPFFPPSVGDPLARSRHFNSWMELIHYAEPSVSHRGGGGFRPPALRAPIHLAAATRGISEGVISLALHSAECHAMSRGGSIISSGFQVCNRDWACFFATVCVPKSGKQPPLHIFCEER